MTQKPYINDPYNQILGQKHGQVTRAVRYALGTLCDAMGKPLKPAQLRTQLKLIQINAATAGDNIIIPALAGVKQIFELVLWNSAAQTLTWQQGATASAQAITQLRLTAFPALTGFTLGFNGSFDQPHWEIDNGQALVLNLSVGTLVDGFIRYRVQNATAA
jgi:hypothetical protein